MFPNQYFSKLNGSISESRYYTSSDSMNDVAGFFEVNISKLPSRIPPDSTVLTATVNGRACLNRHSPVLEKS